MRNFKKNTLAGKSVLITGGAGLLGPQHAIAMSLVGATVVLIDINQERLLEACDKVYKENPDAKIFTFVVDIKNLNEVTALASKLEAKNIFINVLINNAAVNPKMNNLMDISGRVEDYDMQQWENEIAVGITGTFNCSRVFGTKMSENGGGVIINISSDLAIRAPDQRAYSPSESFEDIKSFKPIGYSVVKTSLIGMTKYLAEYWGRKNIRVNALLPGGVYTNQPKHLYENVKKRTLLNRWAKLNEYEDVLIFLASDSSDYMTGQSIVMDGGRSV